MTNQDRAAEVLAKFIAKQDLRNANSANLTNNQKISGRILVEVSKGASTEQAVDTVLGAGAYARIAGMVYEGLTA